VDHGSGIQINGQSFQARGSNLHQDIYGLGNARCVKSIYYDLKRYKEGGLDFVRARITPTTRCSTTPATNSAFSWRTA